MSDAAAPSVRRADPASADPAPADSSPGSAQNELYIARVLHGEEVARGRAFFRMFMVIAVFTGSGLALLPGSSTIRSAVVLVTALGFVLCAVALWLLRDEDRYTARRAAVLGVVAAIVASLAIHYISPFSAAAVALAIGIYFFAGSQSRTTARICAGAAALLHFVSSASLASGLCPDICLFPVSGTARSTLWFQVMMSQILIGVTFSLARWHRRTTEAAIEQIRRVDMEIRQRDAQLAEARRELDRALRPGEGRRSGETLGGYRLGDLLGRGGVGEVYRAVHEPTGKHAAVKVLHPHVLDNPEHVQRFLREAEVARAIESPHTAALLELGRTADASPFLVMELLEGHDLGWHLRKSGKLSLSSVADLVSELSSALVVLREHGIVHRDLKPGNLFLTDSIPPRWKLLDFGLSKVMGTNSSLTKDQALGTPSYMAPEQVGGEADHRTDLYAVAAIAYRALTGSPPFAGEDVAEVLFNVVYHQPSSPARFVSLPSDVELVLAIGLAKQPSDRFQQIEELSSALRLAAQGELDDGTRRRGWTLLKRSPWGSSRRGEAKSAR
ncbi:MAG: serine/threonine-protein kinase [Byssovorax sp.]